MLEATKVRLDPLFDKLNEDDKREDQGLTARVPSDVKDNLWSWWSQVQDWYADLDTQGHDLTNAQWRELKGAFKRIGKVKFTNLDERFLDICK